MTKRIGIEINGVLRDTIGKFKQLYDQHMVGKYEFESIDKTFNVEFSGDTEEIAKIDENIDVNYFEYKVISDVTSLNLLDHFSFPTKDDLYSFMYEEYTMELFGHAPSTEMTTFNTLNELYYDLRDNYDILIVSDEIGKSKPSSLFFLSKFGCLIEKVLFYSEITKNKMFEDLADCEKGPNGGRVMWFPPYGLSVSESVSAGWNTSEFLGRPEPIYTYK